ncbi:MAG: UvrD-helicase domain-containing protein [Bacteroidota bacterium]
MAGLVIYKSSAGSGKTYTLVYNYLKIVIANPWDYRHVLAITFTNKATEEMKARIIDTLSELASLSPNQQSDHPLYQQLSAHLLDTDPSGEREVSRQARTVLNLILNDYSNFSVSTIESFFQKIVRAFTRELNIPIGYEIEMQQDIVLDQVVDELFLEIGRNDDLTKLLSGFVERNLNEDRSWNIQLEIKKLAQQLFKEKYQRLLVEYPTKEESQIDNTLALVDELQGIRTRFERFMQAKAGEAIALLGAYNLRITDFKYGKSSIPNYFKKASQDKVYEPGKRVLSVTEQGKNEWYGKTTEKAEEIEAVLAAGLDRLLKEMISMYQDRYVEYISAVQILRSLHSFGLLHDLQKKLSHYRRENNQLIISDTSYLIKEIIHSQYDTPFIYEKVGNRYTYYLIDEFQDTSDMQWHNLFPLVLEALARGDGGMIVGDVKQSIYRWRSGNMELLLREVEQSIQLMGQAIEPQSLSHNWRTGADIVHFNNEFFALAAERIGDLFSEEHAATIRLAYEQVAQTPMRDFDAYVELNLLEGLRPKGEEVAWMELSLERTTDTIRQLQEEGFKGGEITLLVRRNKEGVILAEHLQKEGIPVISAESLLVDNHPQVILLLSLLEYLHQEQDEVAAATLRFYFGQVTAEDRGTLHQTFADKAAMPNAFVKAMAKLRQLPVYQCVEEMLRLFPALSEPNAYVQGFLDAVLRYSGTKDASISGFLSFWDEVRHKTAIASAPDPEAVQIMTIHKSKGLEFPVVILPFADWDLGPNNRDFLWLEEPQEAPYDQFPFLPIQISSKIEQTYFEQTYANEKRLSYLDNLNMLYVAFTRPELRLYIFAPDDHKKAKYSAVRHLLSDLPRSESLQGEWDEAAKRFRRGLIVPRSGISHKQDDPHDAIENLELVSNVKPHENWNSAIKIRFSSNSYLPADIQTRNERISLGNLLHDAMDFIKVVGDLPRAVKTMVNQGKLLASEASDLHNQLERIINLPTAKDWFDGSWVVRNEAEIIAADGSILRPDRVMIKGSQVVVVDYKTGKASDRYYSQLRKYMRALQDIGYQSVSGFLYYLQLGKIEEVSI